MVSFSPTFGGAPNQPSNVSYASYSFSSTLSGISLDWPTGLQATDSPSAAWIDIMATVNGASMALPPGIQGSMGASIIFNNLGAFPMTVLDTSGNTIATVSAGTAQLALLYDNSFSAGLWRTLQYGASIAQAQAALLAGAGLGVAGGLLRIQWPVTILNSPYNVGTGDRATILEWTGGSGAFIFPTASVLGNNFILAVNNSGSGALTLTPTGCTIDGAASVVLSPGGSCFVACDGTNLITIGRGQQASSTVTTLIKALPSSGNVQLSGAEITAQIQQFTGALAGATNVIYNATPNEYFVWNNTTGGQTLTFRSTSADSGVAVAQGTHAIIKNDGTAVYQAQTLAAGTVIQIQTGSGLVGGPITTSGIIDVATVSGMPSQFDMLQLGFDVYGRWTSSGPSPSFNSLSNRALVVDQSRTFSAGVITASGGRIVGQPLSLTWSSVITIDLSLAHNFDLVAISGIAQLTLTGTPQWGQGGVISVQNNASGNANLSYAPPSTWFAAASAGLTQSGNARTLLPYYVDSSTPPRVVLSPLNSGMVSL